MSDDGIRLVGYVNEFNFVDVKSSPSGLGEFRDFISVSGSCDIETAEYDALVEALGVTTRPRPKVDINIITRRPQLVLQHRRGGWRSKLRFLVVAETYKGATIEFVE